LIQSSGHAKPYYFKRVDENILLEIDGQIDDYNRLIIFSTWLTRLADTEIHRLSIFGFCLAVIGGQLRTFAIDPVVYNLFCLGIRFIFL
jgi:hypothetical protein